MSRAQVALEFLTTYAWAFLVIIIMVGALAYFGVLSPSKLLPDRCNFGSEITCNKDLMVVKSVRTGVSDSGHDEYSEDGTADTLSMRLKNNFATSVTISDAIATTDVAAVLTCYALIDKTPPDTTDDELDPGPGGASNTDTVTWSSDETITFLVRCGRGDLLVPKEKIKFAIEINYYPSTAGPGYGKKVFGEVFTTIQ